MPSDPEKLQRWLLDIHDHIAKAESFVAGLTYEAFESDEMRVYAVTRCLEIISEASRRLPDDFKARYPAIKWREMAAAGTVVFVLSAFSLDKTGPRRSYSLS